MAYSEDEHLETLARHGWRGTPWDERTPERQEELKRTDWIITAEAWFIGGTIAWSLALGLWGFISCLFH